MLKLLMIQNSIFNEFISHQLGCKGVYVFSLCTSLKDKKWSYGGVCEKIKDKPTIREFLAILTNENIAYNIKRQCTFSSDKWKGFEIVIG